MGRIRPRRNLYLWLATGMCVVAFWGFSQAYLGRLASGTYPRVSPWLHVHALSFLAWYSFLPLQAGLIAARRIRLHRALGLSSVLLAAIMVFSGALVLSVRLDDALDGAVGFPWLLFGPGILFTLVSFAGFYTAAILTRHRPALHKRWIIVASCAPLSSPLFRILDGALPAGPGLFTTSLVAANLFIVVGMIGDRISEGRAHRAYAVGLTVCLPLAVVAVPLATTGAGVALNRAVASLSGVIGFLY